MKDIRYIDRTTRIEHTEKVYGKVFIEALYGTSVLSRIFSAIFLPFFSRFPIFSRLYGALQKSKISRRKVLPFIRKFGVDASEFLDPPSSFASFNDFFIRKLKPSARPVASSHDIAVLPADARYRVYENVHAAEGFLVKGHKFTLEELLGSVRLAHIYKYGSMAIARLAPVDYHRFHFPVNCLPGDPREIPGPLYSVNPIALRRDIDILSRNKRTITHLYTKSFGTVLYIEVGATYVGTIHQTFIPEERYAKGDEKGYFSFGGSCIILLFEPHRIEFDRDLVDATHRGLEVLGKFGQSLGRALSPL